MICLYRALFSTNVERVALALAHQRWRGRVAPLYPADFAGRARAMRFIDWFNGVWEVAPNAIASPEPDVARIDVLAEAMAGALVAGVAARARAVFGVVGVARARPAA